MKFPQNTASSMELFFVPHTFSLTQIPDRPHGGCLIWSGFGATLLTPRNSRMRYRLHGPVSTQLGHSAKKPPALTLARTSRLSAGGLKGPTPIKIVPLENHSYVRWSAPGSGPKDDCPSDPGPLFQEGSRVGPQSGCYPLEHTVRSLECSRAWRQ